MFARAAAKLKKPKSPAASKDNTPSKLPRSRKKAQAQAQLYDKQPLHQLPVDVAVVPKRNGHYEEEGVLLETKNGYVVAKDPTEALEARIAILTSERDEARADVTRLQAEVASLDQGQAALSDQCSALEGTIQELERQNAHLEEERLSMNTSHEALVSHIEELKHANDTLYEYGKSTRDDMQLFEDEVERLTASNSEQRSIAEAAAAQYDCDLASFVEVLIPMAQMKASELNSVTTALQQRPISSALVSARNSLAAIGGLPCVTPPHFDTSEKTDGLTPTPLAPSGALANAKQLYAQLLALPAAEKLADATRVLDDAIRRASADVLGRQQVERGLISAADDMCEPFKSGTVDGQTLQPSHVGPLQDHVRAWEADLRRDCVMGASALALGDDGVDAICRAIADRGFKAVTLVEARAEHVHDASLHRLVELDDVLAGLENEATRPTAASLDHLETFDTQLLEVDMALQNETLASRRVAFEAVQAHRHAVASRYRLHAARAQFDAAVLTRDRLSLEKALSAVAVLSNTSNKYQDGFTETDSAALFESFLAVIVQMMHTGDEPLARGFREACDKYHTEKLVQLEEWYASLNAATTSLQTLSENPVCNGNRLVETLHTVVGSDLTARAELLRHSGALFSKLCAALISASSKIVQWGDTAHFEDFASAAADFVLLLPLGNPELSAAIERVLSAVGDQAIAMSPTQEAEGLTHTIDALESIAGLQLPATMDDFMKETIAKVKAVHSITTGNANEPGAIVQWSNLDGTLVIDIGVTLSEARNGCTRQVFHPVLASKVSLQVQPAAKLGDLDSTTASYTFLRDGLGFFTGDDKKTGSLVVRGTVRGIPQPFPKPGPPAYVAKLRRGGRGPTTKIWAKPPPNHAEIASTKRIASLELDSDVFGPNGLFTVVLGFRYPVSQLIKAVDQYVVLHDTTRKRLGNKMIRPLHPDKHVAAADPDPDQNTLFLTAQFIIALLQLDGSDSFELDSDFLKIGCKQRTSIQAVYDALQCRIVEGFYERLDQQFVIGKQKAVNLLGLLQHFIAEGRNIDTNGVLDSKIPQWKSVGMPAPVQTMWPFDDGVTLLPGHPPIQLCDPSRVAVRGAGAAQKLWNEDILTQVDLPEAIQAEVTSSVSGYSPAPTNVIVRRDELKWDNLVVGDITVTEDEAQAGKAYLNLKFFNNLDGLAGDKCEAGGTHQVRVDLVTERGEAMARGTYEITLPGCGLAHRTVGGVSGKGTATLLLNVP